MNWWPVRVRESTYVLCGKDEEGIQCALRIAGDSDSGEPMMPEYDGWHQGFVAVRAGSKADIRSR